MMDEDQQPRAEWVFPEPGNRRTGRIWLIVCLAIAAILIVGIVLVFVILRGADPTSAPTPSTASPSSTPSPSPSPTSAPTSTPDPTPITTQPPVPDPGLDVFAGQVGGWLSDASTGLGIVPNLSGQEASQVVDTLQGDADRLSSAVAPSSISEQWYSAAEAYTVRLSELRAAVDSGEALQAPLDNASAALQQLRDMVGL